MGNITASTVASSSSIYFFEFYSSVFLSLTSIFFHISLLRLKWLELYLPVCHLPSSLSPPLPPFVSPLASLRLLNSRLVWRHQTACIFSAATDGAVTACQGPECSLSQLSGPFPGLKWIPSTWGGKWWKGGGGYIRHFPTPLSPIPQFVVVIASYKNHGKMLAAALSAPLWELLTKHVIAKRSNCRSYLWGKLPFIRKYWAQQIITYYQAVCGYKLLFC